MAKHQEQVPALDPEVTSSGTGGADAGGGDLRVERRGFL